MRDLVAKVVLVDIEGTTTSISFVHDVLFPYAKENVRSYLSDTWESADTEQIVMELEQAAPFWDYIATLKTAPIAIDVEVITGFVRYLIDKDLKLTPLKTLQGLIWARGYADGQLKGHMYEDVPAAFKAWLASGLSIAVYSSGSVAAQKLIFRHSVQGDLLQYISAHFDTHVGHKQEQESYVNIAKALEVEPTQVLFLTDVIAEAAAARAAGMQVIILRRPGNAPLTKDQKSAHDLMDDFTKLHAIKRP